MIEVSIEEAQTIEASMIALLAIDDVVQAERRLEEENAAEGDRSSAAEDREAERRRQERLDRQYETSERVEFFRRVHDAERRRWDRLR